MATQSVKDILNTEVPKPSFVLSPSVPAPLPSGVTVTRNGGDNVARTLDPYSGKFEHVPEDTPRVYGDDQSLLVEAASRTNHVNYSADYTQWVNDGTTINFASSILGGQNATSYQIINNGSQSDSIQAQAGSFSSSMEVVWAILEEGNSTSYEVGARDTNNFNTIGGFIYDLQNGNIFPTGASNTISVNKRTITNNGPNGGKVVLCVARYDPTDGINVSGAGREAQHFPDTNGNSGNAIVHQTQIEEAPNASSPIVTTSSAKTRAGDNYTIFSGGQPDWWNPNEGTLFVEAVMPAYNHSGVMQVLSDSGADERWIGIQSDGGVLSFNGDAASVSKSISPYNTFKAATTVRGSEFQTVVDGVAGQNASTNGNLLSINTLSMGRSSNLILTVKQILYYPRALPESTLNTLTS